MKYCTLFFFVFMGLVASAQKKAELSFGVSGLCGMCENRIEKSLDISGIIMADWNIESKQLAVAYKTNKIQEKAIHQLVADAGHDTDQVKASDEAYANLHECCKYRESASCPEGEEKD